MSETRAATDTERRRRHWWNRWARNPDSRYHGAARFFGWSSVALAVIGVELNDNSQVIGVAVVCALLAVLNWSLAVEMRDSEIAHLRRDLDTTANEYRIVSTRLKELEAHLMREYERQQQDAPDR